MRTLQLTKCGIGMKRFSKDNKQYRMAVSYVHIKGKGVVHTA